MRGALLIAGKDLRQRLRDRSAVLVAVDVPLVLASIFGLIFHNLTGGGITFTLGLVDLDHGPAARAFEAQALAPLERSHLIEVRRERTAAAGRHATDHGSVAATFVIPAGFSAAIARGRPAELRVLGDVGRPIGVQVAQSIAQAYAARVDTIRIASAALGVPVTGSAARIAAGTPISVGDVSTKNRQLDAGTFYAAGMAVFFLFFTVQFGISSVLEERRDGTLARLLAAPIHRGAVLSGKLLTSILLGCLSMALLAVATHFLLSAHWGNPLAWQSMVALVLGMLGGTFFPVSQAGGVLAKLSLIAPQAWFLRGIEDLGGGAGPSVVLGPAAAMLVFAAVTGTLAFLRIGKLVAR